MQNNLLCKTAFKYFTTPSGKSNQIIEFKSKAEERIVRIKH